MSVQAKVANRYARAIFDLKVGEKKKHQIQEELAQVAVLAESSKELRSVVHSRVISGDQAAGVMEEIAKKAKLLDETKKSLEVIARAKRLPELGLIADNLRQLILESEEIALLKVSSRDELEVDDKKEIEKKFKDVLGKDVQASFATDPKLIGGIRVTAEGRTYDGTLVTRLNRMKEALAGGM